MKNFKQQIRKQSINAASIEFVVKSNGHLPIISVSLEFISLLNISKTKTLRDVFEANTVEKILTSIKGGQTSFQIQSWLNNQSDLFDLILIPIGEESTWQCTIIKQHNQSEESFILSEKREAFERLYEATNVLICIADTKGNFLQLNHVATSLLGYTNKELRSKPLIEFVHPDDQERTKSYLENNRKGRDIKDFDNRYIHKNGSVVWLRWSSFLDPETNLYFAIAHDITENKKLRLMLQEASEVSKTGAWSYDPKRKMVEWSDMTKKIYEVETFDTVDLQTALRYYKEGDSREHAKEVFEEAMKNGSDWDIEVEIVTEKNKNKWVRCIGKAEMKAGEVIRLYGSFQDISQRKKNEQLLIETLAEKRMVLNSISDAFYTIDRNWKITYWNHAAEKFSGITEEEVLGKSIWELYPKSPWKESYERAVEQNQKVQFESYSIQWKIYSEVTLYPSEKGLTVIIKDISDRKKAENEIKLMNERFQLAAEASDEAIWDWDIEGQSFYWNQAFYKYTGYQKKDIHDKGFSWWVNLLHPIDRQKLLESFMQTIKDPNKEIWHQEFSIRKANSEYGAILSKGKLIRNKEGKVIRMVGAFIDITAQKDYEESLKQLNQQLLTSNQELEQFAYAASHDLQEPLRMVVSFLERLENKYSDQLDEKGKKYIEFAVDGGKRMRRMVMDLLDYSRVGRRKGSLEDVSLNEVVEEVKTLNKKAIEESNAIIKSEDLPSIIAYRSAILQIFHNIISNAIKYRKEGVPAQIEIKSTPKGKMIQIEINDNGIGIHSDFYEKVFAVFQRLHGREEYKGTGIGLAIVKKVVTQFGGEIWIESKEGEGSTFYFTLPKKINEATESKIEKSSID